jgi:hypothetical protein
LKNAKNDEDVEKMAENFFVGLYQMLEKTKLMFKDELR